MPTTAPGFSYSTIHTVVESGTTNAFSGNVRVPDAALIGEVNRGWKLITNQPNCERVAIAPPGMVERVYEGTVRWAAGAARSVQATAGGLSPAGHRGHGRVVSRVEEGAH